MKNYSRTHSFTDDTFSEFKCHLCDELCKVEVIEEDYYDLAELCEMCEGIFCKNCLYDGRQQLCYQCVDYIIREYHAKRY